MYVEKKHKDIKKKKKKKKILISINDFFFSMNYMISFESVSMIVAI